MHMVLKECVLVTVNIGYYDISNKNVELILSDICNKKSHFDI